MCVARLTSISPKASVSMRVCSNVLVVWSLYTTWWKTHLLASARHHVDFCPENPLSVLQSARQHRGCQFESFTSS